MSMTNQILKSIAGAACLFCSVSYSGVMGNNEQSLHPHGAVLLGLTGGWFQSMLDNNAYAINSTVNTVPPRGYAEVVTPDFQWGGGVDVDYLFNQSPYDIKLAYFYLNNNKSATRTNPDHIGITLLPASWVVTYANRAHSSTRLNLNQVELSSGFYKQLSSTLNVHPKIGLLYLDLENNQNTNYTGQDLGAAVGYVIQNASFRGLAPSFGVDIKQNVFWNNLSFFANIVYSPTLGSLHASYSAALSDNSVFPAQISMNNRWALLSYLRTDIGIGYGFSSCCFSGNFKLGYTINQFIGGTARQSLSDSNAGSELSTSINNAGYQGPYIRIEMSMN